MDINNIVNSTRMRNARLLDDINNKILNREYYKFKYLPFEGALPGLYFQQQTEDAINDIGNVAYATEKVADEALQVAQQAYNIALAALETANNALAAAQTAQQTANSALSIANNALSVGTSAATAAAAAQNRADEAYDLAGAAQKAADAAQKAADAAQKAANSAANDATNALTKAEDALTKIEQLSVLNYYNNLTKATDVNTLVDIHRWYLQASNNPNAPETNPGFLNVDNDHNDSVCKQLWVSETTGAIYNRFGQIVENSDPATVSSWSEWYKLATKADADEAYDLAGAAQKAADAAQKAADAAQKAANSAANDATNALTKAEDALTKIEQLSVLNYYNNLTKATDVNTLVDIHRWYLQASNNPNAPETNPGFLNVDNDHNDSVCKQLWVSETTGAIYNRFGQIVENSDPATVSSWSEWYKLATKADIDGTTTDLTKKITTVANNLATHEADVNNPHKVTAKQLGLTTVYQYKGSVATYADLPTTGQKVGDVWNVETADPDHGIKAGDNVAWDGAQWDILGGNHDLSGYAQLNLANTFTALNTFRANIAVSSGTTAGSQGQIILGNKPQSATVQANIISSTTGALNYIATENAGHYFNVGTAKVATIGGTATTATLDFLANSILKYSTSSGLRVGGGGTSKIIGFYPEAANNTAGMRLSNQAEAISTDYSIFSLQNNSAISYTKNAALQVGNFKILEVDRNNNNVTIKADSNGQILFTPNNLASNTSSIDSNGNFYISQGLTVGSKLNTGMSNGVIRAGNNEICLYFTGTAENTYFATPKTGNTINYQSEANCYLIDCSINNPSGLNINFSHMNFKAPIGSVPYMCKTLTFLLPVGATVPAVTWTFPTGSAVYYPKGVAPTLTANANNIINVMAIANNTSRFSIHVFETVVLPYSG